MEYLLIGLCLLSFLAAAALVLGVFSPVVITVDSRRREVCVRWLIVVEYRCPLPGSAGESNLYVFRKTIPFAVRKANPDPQPAEPQRKRRMPARFLMRCLGDSSIRHKLARQISKLLKQLFRSAEVAPSGSTISLPDPALNGLLAGALASVPRRLGIRVNFTGENTMFLELHLHPYRVLRALLFFTSGLPFRAMFKQWRSLAAARPR